MPAGLSFRPVLRHLGAMGLMAFILAPPAFGQTAEDLAALRYYIQQNDQPAADAELRRLRIAFPNWQPPEDLTTLGTMGESGEDIDRIYQLIASGDADGAQRALDAARQKFPDWTPPAALVSLLQITRAQNQFDTVVASDPARADQIARANPALTRCDRIDNVWRLAEAQQRAGQTDQARGAYRAIITACPRYPDVVATLQKADAVTTQDQLAELFAATARRFPSNANELATLHEQLRAGHGPAPAAAPPAASASAPARARREAPAAAPPPTRAPSSGSVGDAVATPATQWDRLPARGDPRLASMRSAMASGDWARCVALTPDPRSLDLLNERGWCSLNLGRPMEALASFAAVAKGRVNADVARDARFGMAMSYLDMKMSNDAAKISASTNFTRAQRIDVEHEILVQRALEAYRKKEFTRAIGYLDAAEQMRALNRGLGVLRAYAYLNSGKRKQAYDLFSAMHDQLAGDDTRAGMNATQQD